MTGPAVRPFIAVRSSLSHGGTTSIPLAFLSFIIVFDIGLLLIYDSITHSLVLCYVAVFPYQANEVRRKIVNHNPYADAIGRDSVERARLLITTKDTRNNSNTNNTTKTLVNASTTIEGGAVGDDPTVAPGRDTEATVVARW